LIGTSQTLATVLALSYLNTSLLIPEAIQGNIFFSLFMMIVSVAQVKDTKHPNI
jgi:hypothetical protein